MSIWSKLFGRKYSPPESASPYSLAALVVTGSVTGREIARIAQNSGKEVIYLTRGHGRKKHALMAMSLSHDFAQDPLLVFTALVDKRVSDSVVLVAESFIFTDPRQSLRSLRLQCHSVLIRASFVHQHLNYEIPVTALLMRIAEQADNLGLTYRFELVGTIEDSLHKIERSNRHVEKLKLRGQRRAEREQRVAKAKEQKSLEREVALLKELGTLVETRKMDFGAYLRRRKLAPSASAKLLCGLEVPFEEKVKMLESLDTDSAASVLFHLDWDQQIEFIKSFETNKQESVVLRYSSTQQQTIRRKLQLS